MYLTIITSAKSLLPCKRKKLYFPKLNTSDNKCQGGGAWFSHINRFFNSPDTNWVSYNLVMTLFGVSADDAG